jgi:hypothetical protein
MERWTNTLIRSHLKNVFCPNFCVEISFQLLEILQYVCGVKLGPASNLNQNPIFEMASRYSFFSCRLDVLIWIKREGVSIFFTKCKSTTWASLRLECWNDGIVEYRGKIKTLIK